MFFVGCNLGCVFCQNYEISHQKSRDIGIEAGIPVSPERLTELFFSLKDQQANNINLVTADIHIPAVAQAIALAKAQGLDLPVIFNSGSYIMVESLRMLEGLVDVYLPDFKSISQGNAAARLTNFLTFSTESRSIVMISVSFFETDGNAVKIC